MTKEFCQCINDCFQEQGPKKQSIEHWAVQ